MQRILVRRPGNFDRLELVEEPTPAPRAGEVLVEVVASGVNFADIVVRLGLYPSAKKYVGWPITPGFEFSGRVAALGAGVDDLQVGDEVFGVSLFGAYASHVSVARHFLLPVPKGVSLAQSAAVAVANLTAYYALVELGAARAGKRVLVHSAAGGVGSALVQMGKALGCFVVGVVGSSHKVDTVRGFGADVVIDKSSESLPARLIEIAGEGFDIVLDANGYETLRTSYRSLRPTGRLVVYGAHSMLTRGSGRPNWFKLIWTFLRTPWFNPLDLTNENKSVLAFNLSYLFEEREMYERSMRQIVEWIEGGVVRIPEVVEYPLAEAGRAHEALQSGRTVGKLILRT